MIPTAELYYASVKLAEIEVKVNKKVRFAVTVVEFPFKTYKLAFEIVQEVEPLMSCVNTS